MLANAQQLKLINQGVPQWNEWRERNPNIRPDLQGVRFENADLSGINLDNADLRRSFLRSTSLIGASIQKADLSDADASNANFRDARASGANFSRANLTRANFYRARLFDVNFSGANLYTTIFRASHFDRTVLADVDLETAIGLDEINHAGHSSISIDTISKSGRSLSPTFLKGIGVPPIFIDYAPSLAEASIGLSFNSCFISYSHSDEPFAEKLWAALRNMRIRVWYAPEEMQGGKTLIDQIDRAISMHDKLLLVLSDRSMQSNWVETEIRRALKIEKKTGQRKLFPIRLVDMESIQNWTCFDADSGRDLAMDIRNFYIPDFSNWIRTETFEQEFKKLCRDLKQENKLKPN